MSDEEDVACSFGFAVVLLRAGVLSCTLFLLPIGQNRWVPPEELRRGDLEIRGGFVSHGLLEA